MNQAISTSGVTDFQMQVYEACKDIPEGMVSTYKYLAEAIGCNSSRAVGQALKRNPFAPEVPCHRVIKTDLSLGGFFGVDTGPEVERKKKRLEAEGIIFADGKLEDKSLIYSF